ncbi:TetR family transcriptional regulator [Paenibacillus pectinilyticus]|uniref:TetR family transcriptional regulator n=1 Tax=Paenibacillus pectinilyticus TaxID=512399 RepID=A0A1C1A6F9_9BACL|nr:TetR/AcrR family transcriptional regulator [Paenibacillus pectinilyticus]OCT16150.1 TetR family transcriptional regulator [Paenibacillus pectinilyticus]
MSTSSSRTDPRVLRTRQLIRDAFIELLQEIELEKITVNRLAERATINRVTFYLHYRDIPDMLERMADDMDHDIHTILNDLKKDANPDFDWNILVKLLEHFAEHAKFYKVVLASKRIAVFTERLMVLMVDLINDRIEHRGASSPSGDTSVHIPQDIVTWYSSSAFIGTIVFWLSQDMPYTPLFLAKQLSLLAPSPKKP